MIHKPGRRLRPRILLILQTFSTLALLIYPLSLSAQNSFSLSVDLNSAAGDQAVTSLNTSADQVIAIQIFGKDIQNANGLSVRFEYETSQVTYDGFDVGNVLPNAQALPEQGTNPTYVEIGMASLGGQATANSGLVGTVRFRTTAAFSGTAIRLVRAELSRSGRFETIMPNIRIALQGAPTPAAFSLSLDVDGTSGDQADTSVNLSADEIVAIQIFGQDIRNANGVSIRFEYDANQVVYEGFDAGNVLPNVQSLPAQGSGVVQINLVSFGGQATINSGLIGTIRFRTMEAFSGTAIRLVRAELGRGGKLETITPNIRIELQLQALTPDFDGDGRVGFSDFLLFGSHFGARQGDGRYEARFDLDSDGAIGFGDFLIFGSDFGKEVSSGSGGSGGGTGGTGLVDIPDANLRAVIEKALGKTSNAPISRAEMASLTRLEAPNKNISDLTGLAFATRLTSLDLGTEWVSGEGNVNSNHISDLSTLSDLTNLTRLSLSNNDISNITPLSNLTNLTTLDLNDNFVSDSDITLLSGLTNLRSLNLGNNDISNITPLSNLTNLTTLNLNDNFVSDSDIALLSGLTSLEWLYLSNNDISNIAPLSDLTSLRSLYLGNNSISDISVLSNLTSLTRLHLDNNSISDISPLASLTNLRSLNLDSTGISNLSVLSSLTNLTWLSLSLNSISNITPLSSLTNLTSLTLWNNSITDISALSALTNLEWLSLSLNSISDVSALSALTNLKWLYLSRNSISNIAPLSGLTNLINLYLDRNSISDLSPLVANTGLGEGDQVDVRHNPLSATSINTHIPVLQNRGVDVRFGASKPGFEETEPRMPYPENENIVNGGRP